MLANSIILSVCASRLLGNLLGMKIFSPLYALMLRWSAHPKAQYYLAGLSFLESSVFPIPPDFMLAPMALVKPPRAWWYATLATISSAAGALLGYLIGVLFFALISPWLIKVGYGPYLLKAEAWFNHWGVLVMFLAAFTPIPFKVFTITAGVLHMPVVPFFIISCIGRGMRFYLVAGLIRWGGSTIEPYLRRWIDWIGWSVIAIIIIGFIFYRL